MNKLFIIFLLLLMCAFSMADQNKKPLPRTFNENTAYTLSFAYRGGNKGKGTLIRRGEKYFLSIHLRIFGSSLFGETTSKSVKEDTGYDAPSEWFVKGAKSFDDIPALKARVLGYLREVEDVFATDFLKLTIEPVFVDDEYSYVEDAKKNPKKINTTNGDPTPIVTDVASESGMDASTLLLASFVAREGEGISVVIQPKPSTTRASPGLWDLYSPAPLMAHELGHNFGISREGYEYSDYPPNGLMSDESNLIVLKELAPEVKQKIQRMDFNTIIAGDGGWDLGVVSRIEPRVDVEIARKEFTPNLSSVKEPWPGGIDYMSRDPKQRIAMVRENVKKRLPQLKAQWCAGALNLD